jgi:hypothetical protein
MAIVVKAFITDYRRAGKFGGLVDRPANRPIKIHQY